MKEVKSKTLTMAECIIMLADIIIYDHREAKEQNQIDFLEQVKGIRTQAEYFLTEDNGVNLQ